MKKNIQIIFIILTIFSCKDGEHPINSSLVKELDMAIDQNAKSFCELVEEVRFIKLETTKESLIGAINQVGIFDNKIFVHDLKTQSIFIFNYPNGKFINKVMAQGNSPGEYLGISSFLIDKDENSILILDRNLSKIFKYNFDGEFVDYKSIPFYASSFTYINKNKDVLFSNYSLSGSDEFDYQAIITDKDFNIKNQFLKIEKFSSMQIRQGNQISILTNNAMFLPKNSVTSYNVTNTSISPRYFYNFKNNWNEDIFYKDVESPRELVELLKKKEIIRGLGATEGDDFLLTDFWFIKDHYLALYNKERDKLNYIEKSKNGYENRFFIKGYHQGYFISAKYHDNLKSAIKNDIECYINEKTKKMILNLNEIDNPVLMFAKFKK